MKNIKPSHYAQVLLRISEFPDLDKNLENFINLIKKNGQISKLGEILKAYEHLVSEKKEGAKGRLSVAISENQKEISELASKIKIPGIKKIRIVPEIDKNILGGFILRVKNFLIDASLKKQIDNLRKSLSA